jgi:hypothetical protein
MNYCNYCPGYCCYRLEGSVLLLDGDDINRLARHFAISDGEVRKRYLENRKNTFKVKEDGACIFQSSDKMIKRCTIHPVRPRQCRMFPYDDIAIRKADVTLPRLLRDWKTSAKTNSMPLGHRTLSPPTGGFIFQLIRGHSTASTTVQDF